MSTPFTPERLYKIRRMRKARLLWKQQPVFAYSVMLAQYPDYTYDQFWDDLRRRSKPKKKKSKSSLAHYGRYPAYERLLANYRLTGNFESIKKAIALRGRITKPYRLLVQIGRTGMEYTLSPLISLSVVEQLNAQVTDCKDFQAVEKLVDAVRAKAWIK